MPKKVVKRSKPKKRVARRSRVQESLVAKLDPRRFTAMSDKTAAIVGYIIDKKFTEPEINDIAVTSDGFVLAQLSGDIGHNMFIGEYREVERNWDRLIHIADLTPEEMSEAKRLFRSKVSVM